MNFNITGAAERAMAAADRVSRGLRGEAPARTENQKLVEDIIEARREVARAEAVFNEMTDTTGIDYASYNIMAAKARYSYLMNLARERKVHF